MKKIPNEDSFTGGARDGWSGWVGLLCQAVPVALTVKMQPNTFHKKTGLQPVSNPVEQVHYFGEWVENAKSLWCSNFVNRQTHRCIKDSTKVCKT